MDDIQHAVEKYKEIQRLLSESSFTVSNHKEINYGLQFSVKTLNWSGLVRIYQNKKGAVRVDLSQLDQSDAAATVRSFVQSGKDVSSEDVFSSAEKEIHFQKRNVGAEEIRLPMIGSDESGKGDYFGPLVVACVYADYKIAEKLVDVGAIDSKALSDIQVAKVARSIKSICVDRFAVVEIMPERYNQMYADLKKEKKTLNDMLAWAHAKAIESLLDKVDCQTAVVDKFCNESLVLSRLQEKGRQLNVIQVHRAESYIAVAAASIIARERFITRLSKLGKEYGVQLPKGASEKAISVAKQLISENDEGVITKVAKAHFKTTQLIST